jgi:tetratricopeptide (TPR) repeat protein
MLWPRTRLGRALWIAVPLLLILLALAPFAALVSGMLDLLGRLFAPLVATPTGRLLLLNAVLLVLLAVLAFGLRGRWRDLRSGLRLRAHLEGIAALVEGESATAAERLRRVAGSRAQAPRELPEIGAQARLGLARLAVEAGDSDAALRDLAGVPTEGLPAELRRSALQLRLAALDLTGEVLPEALEHAVDEALAEFPDDLVLLRRRRDLLRARGALDEAVTAQRRIAACAAPAEAAAERTRLARDLVLAGEAALRRGGGGAVDEALARAEEARRIDGEEAGAALLRGDALGLRGEVRGALRAYAQAASLEALRRAGELLERHPEVLTPREILESFPLDGGLILVARALERRGEDGAARRALRILGREFGWGGGTAPRDALASGPDCG